MMQWCCYDPITTCNGLSRVDGSCCTPSNQCDIREGDCDSDNDCRGNLKCGVNNCPANRKFSSSDDCCYDPASGRRRWSVNDFSTYFNDTEIESQVDALFDEEDDIGRDDEGHNDVKTQLNEHSNGHDDKEENIKEHVIIEKPKAIVGGKMCKYLTDVGGWVVQDLY